MQTKAENPRPAAATCCGCGDLGDLLSPQFFKALCDPNRIAILIKLAECGQPCSVSEVASCCPVDLSVVSRHLALLRDAGLLEASRQGREVRYALRIAAVVETLRGIADAIAACCPPEPTQPCPNTEESAP